MPCSYYTPYEEAAMAYADAKAVREENKKLIKELDLATRLLCSTCKKLEKENTWSTWPRGLKTWWSDHQKRDKERDSFNA